MIASCASAIAMLEVPIINKKTVILELELEIFQGSLHLGKKFVLYSCQKKLQEVKK